MNRKLRYVGNVGLSRLGPRNVRPKGLLIAISAGISLVILAPFHTATAATADEHAEKQRVQDFLASRYKAGDVRHSFHTKFGETIDCIDFFAQKGVKQMAAEGKPITELPKPTVHPNVPDELRDVLFTGTPDDEGHPRACPPDAVPILRITPERIHAAGGLDAFLKAHQHKAPPVRRLNDGAAEPPGTGVDWAVLAHVQQSYTGLTPVIGGTATVSVQKPLVIFPGDHSIMQIWMQDNGNGAAQSVETGVNVDPSIYNDQNPHFFIFATNDGYSNGCYNNVAPHFVLMTTYPFGEEVGGPGDCLGWIGAPGATLTPGMTLATSTFNGNQAELALTTYNGYIGYATSGWNIMGAGVYPSTDFVGAMQSTATTFSVGAEVLDHTQSWYVPMGSGAEPQAGYGQAAYWISPESQGLGVVLSNSPTYPASWDYSSFGDAGSDRPTAYGSNWWGGRVYVGPLENSFSSSNYGYQWSPIGDWAYGSYKAECDYQAGVPLKGVAAHTDGTATESILCGDYRQTVYSSGCYPRDFTNGDNRGPNGGWDPGPNGDWDPGYVKGECGYEEVAAGIAQSTSHNLNTILCCPERGNTDHSWCTVETFGSSNSPSYGSGPDWAIGLYKGVCPVGKAVVGISRESSGAPHALLCCFME